MCKGIESWAWYGLQPINELTKPGGTLIVTSRQQADALLEDIHPKETPYNLSIVTGIPSFSGLWVYKDDHTDARILGALCKVCPDLVSLDAMLETIEEQMGGGTKIASAQRSFDRTATRPVEPGEGGNQREMKFRDARLEDHAGRSGHSGHTRRGRIRRGRGRLRARPKRSVQEFSTRSMRRSSTSIPASSAPFAGCSAPTPASMLPPTGCMTPIWSPAAAVGSARRYARWPTV